MLVLIIIIEVVKLIFIKLQKNVRKIQKSIDKMKNRI